MERGKLIAVEGIDGVGKTTLAMGLEKLGCVYFKMPDRSTPTGRLLNDYLNRRLTFSDNVLVNERAAQLLFGACALSSYDAIESKLAAGKTVVVDRYIFSGLAYHAASTVDDDIYTWTDVLKLIAETYGMLPAADHVVYLDMQPEDAAKRIASRYGSERNDRIDLQRRVQSWYDKALPTSAHRIDVTNLDAEAVLAEAARRCELDYTSTTGRS